MVQTIRPQLAVLRYMVRLSSVFLARHLSIIASSILDGQFFAATEKYKKMRRESCYETVFGESGVAAVTQGWQLHWWWAFKIYFQGIRIGH